MMVSISDNLDALEDDMIIKCAECEGKGRPTLANTNGMFVDRRLMK